MFMDLQWRADKLDDQNEMVLKVAEMHKNARGRGEKKVKE